MRKGRHFVVTKERYDVAKRTSLEKTLVEHATYSNNDTSCAENRI